MTTLQKVIKDDGLFTTVSAEAIRYAIREAFTEAGKTVNRRIGSDGSEWTDPKFEDWESHLDDDLLGFMLPDKETRKRRGRLEITRALSTRPWPGDVVFAHIWSLLLSGTGRANIEQQRPYRLGVHRGGPLCLFDVAPSMDPHDLAIASSLSPSCGRPDRPWPSSAGGRAPAPRGRVRPLPASAEEIHL